MRILHSIQTCRNITRYYCPATRALSSSDQTAVACVNPVAEYAPVKTDLAGKNDYSPVDHCRISQKCLNFDNIEQRKIRFLTEYSDVFSKIINSAQSEVQVKTTGSSLELTGLHGNILQYERKLFQLLQSVASTDFSIPLQVGAVLGFNSPDKLVSKSALAPKVLIELTYDTFSGRANIVATGPTEDVRIFKAELQSMANKVHSANHAVPGHVMSSKNFLKLCAEFNSLPETVVTIQKINEAVQIWSSNALNLAMFRKELDDILKASSNPTVVSVPLRNMRNRKMFNAKRFFPGKHVTLSWKTYDKREETLMMSGLPAAVEEAAAEVQRFDRGLQFATVSIPPNCLGILGDISLFTGQIGQNMFIDKPTLEKPLTLFGDEANVRTILLRIFKYLRSNCAAKEFSQIDTSLCFSYSDYDEFRHDENNLRIFSVTFPKADIEWKTDSDGSIHVKIRSSPSDLDLIRNILKRSRRFQLPHSNRNISMSSLVSVLQQSDKLGDEVLINKVDEENLLLTCYKSDQYYDASNEIQKLLTDPTFQCTRHQTNKKLLLSGNLHNEIRSAAQTYEVSVGFGDDSFENTFVVDVAGSAGNCEIFKTYLDLRLASLDKLSLRFPGDQSSAFASRIFQAIDGRKEDNIVVLHDPKLHEFWIGGTQETVESLHTSLSNHLHEERVIYHDPRISEYLKDKIEDISQEFAAVDINLDTESSEIRLSGFRKEVKELAEKIKSIVSDHGVFEGKLAGRYQYEGSRQSFLKLLTNQSSTDKMSYGLAYDDDRDEVNFQIIGNKSSIKETIDLLNCLGRSENVTDEIELPYCSASYLNHLQQTLGIPDVPDDGTRNFSISRFWGPLVNCNKDWFWNSLEKSPDKRKSWLIQLSGNNESVKEAVRTINTTIENLNFHQIAFVSKDPVVLKVLLQSDFLASAANGDGVRFDVEFIDNEKNKTFINVYGRDKDKVDELVTKINNFLSAGVKSATIECSDYVGRYYPLGLVFYNSRLLDKLKSRKIDYTFEKNGLHLSFVGEPSLVNELEQESREWLENLTTGSYKFCDPYSVSALKVGLNRLRMYYMRRFNRVYFKVSRKEGSISYFGSKEDVAEVDEFMENEVHETFIKDSDPESLAAVARLKRSLFPMYPGVQTVDDKTEIRLRGGKDDVAAVVALLEEANKNKEIRDYTLHLNIDNKLLDIPYIHAKTMFLSSKFKVNWPSLEFLIRGSEIQLVGTQEDIEESSDILANMVSWKVPNDPLRSGILFRDHRSPDGNFRDSHWIPNELLDKLFVVRNKGEYNSQQVILYGRAEDISGVSEYVKHVLPRMGLTREVFPITQLQSEYLRCPYGFSEILSPFEDKVSYVFDRTGTNIELAGDSLSISQMKKSLSDFASERFKVAAVQTKHQYWTARRSDWATQNFPRARFNDSTLRVYGHVNDVNGVMTMLDRSDSHLNMEEMDILGLQIPEDDNSAEMIYNSTLYSSLRFS